MPRPTLLAAALVVALLAPLALWAGLPLVAHGTPSPDQLRDRVEQGRAREQQLSAAADRLGALEQRLSADVAVLGRRLEGARTELAAARARLGGTRRDLREARARIARLRMRLERSRAMLARRLRERYMATRPDLVTVVLEAHGFADLLERTAFLRRIQHADQAIVVRVRDARDATQREARRLDGLQARQHDAVVAITRERDALASMQQALQQRQAALERARTARLAALRDTVAGRRQAERELKRLLAERARAAAQPGPGGPWAIPWPIVQCESGGQNLPPNWAGASGYYQFLDSTWQGLGGSTQHAYQAPKAEQDRLAAELWAGGAGAGNWDCAALVA